VELLIDRVIVTGEEVEIRYVIPTSPRGEQSRFYQLRIDYCDTLPQRNSLVRSVRCGMLLSRSRFLILSVEFWPGLRCYRQC
jgi:hypothetical protein